ITGTSGNGQIKISDVDHSGKLIVSINGRSATFSHAKVRQISLDSRSGRDQIDARFLSGSVLGRSLSVASASAGSDRLTLRGDRASLAGMVVTIGSTRSVFLSGAGTWGRNSRVEPVPWTSVQSVNGVITSVITNIA